MNPLQTYLKENGITQAEFAERLPVSQGTVSKMCRPGAVIRDEMKMKIERLTGGAVKAEAWLQCAKTSRDQATADQPAKAPAAVDATEMAGQPAKVA